MSGRFITNFDLMAQRIYVRDKDLLKQWQSVLRLRVGDEVILADGKLNEALGKIIELRKDFAGVEILKKYKNTSEPSTEVSLFCAVLKRENFDMVVQKATEAGVKSIVPLITKRTIKTGLKLERLNKIAKEASEQSGRGLIPAVSAPVEFLDAVKSLSGAPTSILFNFDGHNISDIADLVSRKINIFVGPEGGWEDDEVKFARESDFRIVSLGDLILRAETAATVASYLAVHLTD